MNYTLDLSRNSILSKEHMILLDEIAEEIRPSYVDFISKLNYQYIADIDWTLSDLAARNTVVCTVFENLCKLELIKRLYEKQKIRSVKIDNPFFYKSIIKNFDSDLIIINNSNFHFRFFQILKQNSKKFIYLFYSYINRFLLSKFVRIKSSLDHKKPVIILESIIYRNSFNDEDFKDRHYPGLFNYISETEKASVLILPYYYGIYNFYKLFIDLKKTNSNFLIPENFLKISDYFYAIFSFLRLFKNVKKIKNIKFKEYDVTDLVLDSYYENIISIGSTEGLLRNRLIKRLKYKNLKIKRFIQWFENQPINKGTIISLKTHYPNTKLIGHIGFYTSPNVVGVYPSKQELDCGLLPDEVAVIGKSIASLIKVYCPNLKIVLSPAFRFQDLLTTKLQKRVTKSYTILVVLPIFKIDYTMILKLVDLAKNQISDCNLLIKTHPGSNHDSISKKLSQYNLINFKTNKNIQESLISSDLVVTSASSSALESIFSRKPTLMISNGSGILKNPIPSHLSSELSSVCYDANDIVSKVKYFKNLSQQQLNDLKNLSNFNISDYIEKNTIFATKRFLGLVQTSNQN